MDSRDLYIALNAHPRMQRAAVCRLAADVDLWRDATPGDPRLAARVGVPLAQLDRALATVPTAAAVARRQRRKAEELGCRLLTSLDDDYPSSLTDLSLPPPVLYCRGEAKRLEGSPAIAIVGARRMDSYGAQAADLFSAGLAARGISIVSGFAMGVDQKAHRAALDVGGTTLAVIGCGLDIDYPRRTRPLADAIAQSGALISEFPFGREPRSWHFPVRNRLIAALSAGVLVIQAKQRSGSLITAHLALDLGREVFAVPGPIFEELALGTNGLLADGACLVSSPDDVLDHLSLGWQQELFPVAEPKPTAPPRRRPDGLPGRVLDSLEEASTPRLAEEVAIAVDVPVDRVLAALLELELTGLVSRHPGPTYRRTQAF